ncbi:hypothetical protein HGRIS_000147 [Hohenbuehelia grisea]|uniref:Uncharacterized protein n=1 Tax=Hohenbuehelia grisea TaxID=104357 RepID=A0ABR3JS11_9AGAR
MHAIPAEQSAHLARSLTSIPPLRSINSNAPGACLALFFPMVNASTAVRQALLFRLRITSLVLHVTLLAAPAPVHPTSALPVPITNSHSMANASPPVLPAHFPRPPPASPATPTAPPAPAVPSTNAPVAHPLARSSPTTVVSPRAPRHNSSTPPHRHASPATPVAPAVPAPAPQRVSPAQASRKSSAEAHVPRRAALRHRASSPGSARASQS